MISFNVVLLIIFRGLVMFHILIKLCSVLIFFLFYRIYRVVIFTIIVITIIIIIIFLFSISIGPKAQA